MIRIVFFILWIPCVATAQEMQIPESCIGDASACETRVDTLRTPDGSLSWIHKAWVAAPDNYLQVWVTHRNRVQHWHRRYPRRRACGTRGVVTSCRGKESLTYYRFPER